MTIEVVTLKINIEISHQNSKRYLLDTHLPDVLGSIRLIEGELVGLVRAGAFDAEGALQVHQVADVVPSGMGKSSRFIRHREILLNQSTKPKLYCIYHYQTD